VQRELWSKFPNPNYVTNPQKGGMHNRGMAVDLTIVDSLGKDWDMGTSFDYFGKEAHMDYMELPKKVISKRIAMKKIMEKGGLKGIRTEWWHYSDRDTLYDLSEWEWKCKK
jgi:D-alanyl-D-alanine dipeptidase